MSKRIIVLCLPFFIFSLCRISAAASEQFSVQAGMLTVTSTGYEAFDTQNSQWTITLASSTVFEQMESFVVTDLTGTNAGWKITMTVGDFENASSIDDPTVSQASLGVEVPAEQWLSFSLFDDAEKTLPLEAEGSDLTPTEQNGTPVTACRYTVNTLSAGSQVDLLSVAPGYGAGEFDFYVVYRITIDDWLPDGAMVKSSTTNGEFARDTAEPIDNAEQKIQIFAGIYQTTITYAIASNPV